MEHCANMRAFGYSTSGYEHQTISSTSATVTGDAVLQETANRCRGIVRAEYTVARWGGDEFIVLMEEVSEEGLEALVVRLREALGAPIAFDGRQIEVGVSVGVVIHREGDVTLDEVLDMADQQMYIDKLQRN